MAYRTILILIVFMVVASSAFSAEGKTASTSQSKDNQGELLTRIDFGNSYITGQTLKSGAVYLLQRKKSEVKSMLKYREHYRKEIFEGNDFGDFKTGKQDEGTTNVTVP